MMNSKRIAPLIFFILILSSFPNNTIVEGAGYGEENDNLGQFTDDFENDDNVSVAYQVINNVTLDCMELNYSSMQIVSNDTFQLREHKFYAAFNPVYAFSIDAGENLLMTSTDASLGMGWEFICIDRDWLNGSYIRFRWKWSGSWPAAFPASFWIKDGSYNRGNDTDFPNGANLPVKGNGNLVFFHEAGAKDTWFVRDIEADVDGGTLTDCSAMWYLIDGFNAQNFGLYIDWIEINEDAGGVNNIWRIDFNGSENIAMERTGTTGDYGYVNNSGLPVATGGFDAEGYFTTEDYLNYTTGESLVLLTNTSLPGTTSMTVEFSSDNSTWVDNEGNAGGNILEAGFYALDLRDLNYTDIFMRYNLSGPGDVSPRIYQSRLVTTNGTAGTTTTTTTEESFFWIFIAIVLSIITALMVWMKYGNN